MDVEQEIEQPTNSSSSSSSTASNSSSNLLVNMPLMQAMHVSMDDDHGDEEENMGDDIQHHHRGNNDVDDNGVSIAGQQQQPSSPPSPSLSSPLLPPPPLPQQSQVQAQPQLPTTTPFASSNNQVPLADQVANNSIFISSLLSNTTTITTTPSFSSSTTTTTTSPHHEHSLSSSHQQQQHHAPSSSLHSNASEDQRHQHHQDDQGVQLQHIADTIDVSIVPNVGDDDDEEEDEAAANSSSIDEDDDGDVILSADNNSTTTTTTTTINRNNQRAVDLQEEATISRTLGVTFAAAAGLAERGERRTPQQSTLLPPILPPPPPAPQHQQQQQQPITLPSASLPESDSEEQQAKHTTPSYSSYFNYPSSYSGGGASYSSSSGSSSTNFAFNNNNNNGAAGSSIIGGTVASMFSNNENNSVGAAGSNAAGGTGASGGGGSSSSIGGIHQHHHHHQQQPVDRLKLLYPNVNENETPLPRCWSPHDKCLSIGLSQNNLRVHYRGGNKQHNDSASVRTAHPIPPACGLYYFEVKIISKGKNGYMGIGLTAQQFRMNRLPGWDKQSYGYHGDDGNSFSSSGNGQSYGPTFTTGDVIGCCVNFVNNTCFYTKNGIDLGIAFRDLPTKLYPTVGLQTPGEEVDANFGQEPFKFDQIEDMMKQMRAEMKASIYNFPMPAEQGDPTALLHKMVSSYLVHNGYSQTAEAFARATSQTFREDISSIRNRQKILKLVLSGRMGQAIEHTLRSYPGLLENDKNLWFMLKCRQFIEMVNGSDIEYCPTTNKLICNTTQTTTTTQTMPPNQTSVIQSTKTYQNGKSTTNTSSITATNNAQNSTTTTTTTTTTTIPNNSMGNNGAVINADNHQHQQININSTDDALSNNKSNEILPANLDYQNDVEMENNGHNSSNGDSYKNGNDTNHFNNSIDLDEEMDIDMSPAARKYSHGIERILEFGKELSQMGQLLEKENKMKDEDRQMLEDAFSLIAYSNPWSSPLGWQLCPSKREIVCTALNSAILESMNYPRRPPLDICVGHANELLRTMAQVSLGACAFVNIEDILPQN